MNPRTLSFIIALCLLLSLAPISAAATDSAVITIDGTLQYDRAFALLDSINELRRENNLAPLVMDQGMMEAAAVRSAELAVRFRVYRPNGEPFYTAYPMQGGYNATEITETNYSNEQFINRYKNDYNLLSAEYKSAGISIFTHNGKDYILIFLSILDNTPAVQPENQTVTQEISIGETQFTLSLLGTDAMEAGTQQELTVKQANLDKKYYFAIWNNDGLNWSSSNPTVATVHDGVISALSAGTAEITVTAGASTASFTVTVTGEAVHSHTMEYREGTPATYYEDGIRSYWFCTVCDRMYEEEAAVNELSPADLVLSKLVCTEHVWNSGVITVASTSSREGSTLYTCIHCSAEKTETVPVNGKTPMHSGDLNVLKPTWEQLTDHINAVVVDADRFEAGQEPSVTAPHKIGKLTDAFLNTGLTYLNYVRYSAGLPNVVLSEEWNESAQYGAVVLGAVNELTHYPNRPADMDMDFYYKGYAATASSNLSQRGGGDTNYNPLHSSIQGCMDDSTSWSNLSGVGHRRWLLSPTLTQVGFGYARSVQGFDYISTKVFQNGSPHEKLAFDYDFISWPASGNMTTNVFSYDTPWSISLNPEKYSTPVVEDLHITLTRVEDNTVWTFDQDTPGPDVAEKQYLALNSEGYGAGSCIIFSPGGANFPRYSGTYLVSVEGLQYTDGSPASLYFEVDFRSITRCKHQVKNGSAQEASCTEDGWTAHEYCTLCPYNNKLTIPAKGHRWSEGKCTVCGAADPDHVITTPTPTPTPTPTLTPTPMVNPFVDVKEKDYFYNPVMWAVGSGITSGMTPTTFAPNNTCTRAQVVTFLWASGGRPAPKQQDNPFTDVSPNAYYYNAVLWAVEQGITSGVSPDRFGPDHPCTRGQVMTFLWRANSSPVSDGQSVSFADVSANAYYYNAVMWAVEHGITSGTSPTSFSPDAPCTRGQIMTFLYKAMG